MGTGAGVGVGTGVGTGVGVGGTGVGVGATVGGGVGQAGLLGLPHGAVTARPCGAARPFVAIARAIATETISGMKRLTTDAPRAPPRATGWRGQPVRVGG